MAGGMVSRINTFLPKIEIVSLATSAIGFAFHYQGNPIGDTLLMTGLSALAAVFYLTAFMRLPDSPASADTLQGLQPAQEKPRRILNLYLPIAWKVIHIAAAVSVVGMLFYIVQRQGYGALLLIGSGVLVISLLIFIIVIVFSGKSLETFKNSLIKNLALLLLSIYILYSIWPLQV